MMANPPTSSLCCTAAPFVLSSTRTASSSRTSAARARATSGRSRPAASPSTPRATSGSPAAGLEPAPPPSGRGRSGVDAAAAGAAAARGAARSRRGSAAAGPADAHVLKFSRDGKFLLQIGTPGKMDGPDSQTTLNRPAAVAVDAARERGLRRRQRQPSHRRCSTRRPVPTSATGAPTARSRPPPAAGPTIRSAAPRGSSATSPASRSRKDGMVYVCDRTSNRIQVFQKDGKFVKEGDHLEGHARRDRRPDSSASSRRTGRCGTSRSRTMPQQRLHLRRGRPRQEGAIVSARHAGGGRQRRRPAGVSPASSSPSAASPSTRAATSTRASSITGSACRSSCTGPMRTKVEPRRHEGRTRLRECFVSSWSHLKNGRTHMKRNSSSVRRCWPRWPRSASAERCWSRRPTRKARAPSRRRGSKSIRCGPNRCRTAGISARSSACRVDAQDHVWIIHRADALDAVEAAADEQTGTCCKKAPPIIEFDQQGNLLRHWGGKDGAGYQWPGVEPRHHDRPQGQHLDRRQRQRQRRPRAEVHAGRQVPAAGRHQAGRARPPTATRTDRFYLVAKVFVDDKTNEVFVADGYGNKRVVVIDGDTGKFKRFWGAYGNKPDDEADAGAATRRGRRRRSSSAARCTAPTSRTTTSSTSATAPAIGMQVFTKEGKFVKEVFVAPDSLGDGSTWDVAFSKDAAAEISLHRGRPQPEAAHLRPRSR